MASRLEEGIELERASRWAEAEGHYRRLLDSLPGLSPRDAVDLRLRHAHALLQLHKLDDAQRAFDLSLSAAKVLGDPMVLGRALLGAGVFAASRGDTRRGEEFLVAALVKFHGRHDHEGIEGEGLALLNLAAIYGGTKRLDLAFVTFDKARERLFATENRVGVATAWEMQAGLRESLGDRQRAEQDFHEAMVHFAREGLDTKVAEIQARIRGRRAV